MPNNSDEEVKKLRESRGYDTPDDTRVGFLTPKYRASCSGHRYRSQAKRVKNDR